jgi:uncharacterized protein YjbJ (UPF0337 family)
MNRTQLIGHLKQVRGRVMEAYGRLMDDPLLIGHGSALVVAGTVQVTCSKATRQWSHAMRGLARRT